MQELRRYSSTELPVASCLLTLKCMNTLKVLLLEDNENDMELIKRELLSSSEYNFKFKWVISKNDFIQALKDFNPDIILSDYNLPQFNGLDALKICVEADPYIPFIIVTGALTDEAAADCIKAGAWDYVVKERLVRLPVTLENTLKLKSEKLKNRSAEEEIKLIRSKTDIQLKLLYDAIDHAPSAIMITDTEGKIIFVNPKFEEITGYKKEEAIGKTARILKSGKHSNEFYKNLWDTILADRGWKGELINKKKSGELYWEQSSISPISDENGKIINFVATKHDITELIRAKEQAEESDKLKSAFLATVSHELRTPLNSILGFSSFINENTPLSEIIEMNNKITYSAQHLLEIVESILDISIIQAKEFKLNKEICSLSEIFVRVKHYLDVEQIRAKNEHLKIYFLPESDPAALKINTDKLRVTQIISILLNNALKFTVKGSIEYGYTIKKNDITFFVKDSGIGISDEKTEFIFEKFRQVEDSKSRKYEGIGLGLSICRELANLLGGSLFVESEPEKGSTFYFSLPDVINKTEIGNEYTKPNITNEFFKINLEGKTILIAEDNDLNYKVLSKMLSVTNAAVLWAKDGQEAVEMFKNNPQIDMVFMDIMMPNMDGYQATIEIKKLKPDMYIIAQTAHTMESEIKKAFESGCDDYLSKPIKKELLYNSLKNAQIRVKGEE